MKSKNFIYIILTVAILQLNFYSKTDENWKLVKNKDGIKAYTRETEGSDVRQVKVKTNIKSTLSAIVSIIKDVNSHKNWIYSCKKAKIIKQVNNTEHYYYNETEAPWSVSNRDIVTHAVIKQNKKTKVVIITSIGIPEYINEIKGVVRIKKLNAQWKFIPKENGTIDLFFVVLIDLGGGLPAWIVNLAVADGPFKTILNMKKEVQKEKYQKTKLSFIEEL